MEFKRLTEQNVEKVAQLYNSIWKEDSSFVDRIQKHMSYEGFKGMIAVDEGGNMIGFSYGYLSRPGQYYYSLLEKALTEKQRDIWLSHCFELVELAVHPEFRKQGIGKQLLNELLEEVSTNTALLTTQVTNLPARTLYDQLKWTVIKEPFFPNESSEPYVIMGKKLN